MSLFFPPSSKLTDLSPMFIFFFSFFFFISSQEFYFKQQKHAIKYLGTIYIIVFSKDTAQDSLHGINDKNRMAKELVFSGGGGGG